MRGIISMAVMALLIGAFVPKMYSVDKPSRRKAMAVQVEPPVQRQ